MPQVGRRCGDAGEGVTFFLEIDFAAGDITETVSQRSGGFQILKHQAAPGTIDNIQCGPHRPTTLTSLL